MVPKLTTVAIRITYKSVIKSISWRLWDRIQVFDPIYKLVLI
jgi:hypothetical protein